MILYKKPHLFGHTVTSFEFSEGLDPVAKISTSPGISLLSL
jgi:hypothetical protein